MIKISCMYNVLVSFLRGGFVVSAVRRVHVVFDFCSYVNGQPEALSRDRSVFVCLLMCTCATVCPCVYENFHAHRETERTIVNTHSRISIHMLF